MSFHCSFVDNRDIWTAFPFFDYGKFKIDSTQICIGSPKKGGPTQSVIEKKTSDRLKSFKRFSITERPVRYEYFSQYFLHGKFPE